MYILFFCSSSSLPWGWKGRPRIIAAFGAKYIKVRGNYHPSEPIFQDNEYYEKQTLTIPVFNWFKGAICPIPVRIFKAAWWPEHWIVHGQGSLDAIPCHFLTFHLRMWSSMNYTSCWEWLTALRKELSYKSSNGMRYVEHFHFCLCDCCINPFTPELKKCILPTFQKAIVWVM